jgi:glycosyltransferase involved in cell wall biosynthesis
MMAEMRVSIVMPVRNAEATLADAIASVRAQSFAEWELILVDDGSTDASLSIAEAAAESDPRITSLVRPNSLQRGAAGARNFGLEHCKGEFVAFLDADDLYEPDKLSVEVRLLDALPQAGMTYGPTLWWRDGGSGWQWTEPMYRERGRLHRPPALIEKVILLNHWHVPCICSVLIRRALLSSVGGFEEQLVLYEDQTLWTKLFLAGSVHVHGQQLARYRQHEGSVSAIAVRQGEYRHVGAHSARRIFLEWVGRYLEEMEVDDRRLWRSHRRAYAPYARPSPQRAADLAYLASRRWLRQGIVFGRRRLHALGLRRQ